ncbi:hypothetical protein A3H38_01775 [candidate division WOR-1 bacterium RIFCSPLOWO2_02_FULL_46_20]|uniref:Uncharacterized protein n=2 Tax=Saganbacteria TaxID=1703751 RepID=A0A1F4RCV5_UNCSA|nr:MAG: hypothetical protein A3J44_02340 [candidate division WOR-1 bacterium RIFCSPHIGHO2_02_FULL_45_12]OGC05956.1 MAG: hypothetical protein A3H38_01775 [candidate division WOR-1 bacterium RIFCSPLOWO2_02_FULL_46_20]OGC09024.1 MAG: hypothetical protein A3F86_02880 [candidate division WOR-1 bacterium RIFCSPLOWO2_12_FULL_45_9]
MASNVGSSTQKYTVADVRQEAARLLKDQMTGLKEKPLSKIEGIKMEALGRQLADMVLKDMNKI